MARMFFANVAGTGTREDFYRADLGADFWGVPGTHLHVELWHPDTDALIGYLCFYEGNVAPVGSVDFGDPSDPASLETTTISNQDAQSLGDLLGVPWQRIRNRTGADVIRFLAKRTPYIQVFINGGVTVVLDDRGPG